MRIGVALDDLLLFSRIDAVAQRAGAEVARATDPADLPTGCDLVLVDWSSRRDGWADAVHLLGGGRVILFGRHTDLEAHAAARAAGLGPMWARSKLVAELDSGRLIG